MTSRSNFIRNREKILLRVCVWGGREMNIILTLTPIYPHLRASVSGATDVDSSEFFSDFSAVFN
jgi:hypothetical protein